MEININDALRDVKSPTSRKIGDIVDDLNRGGTATAEVQEIINVLDYVVGRLVYADSNRFN